MSQDEPLHCAAITRNRPPPPPPPKLDLYMPAMPPLGLIHALEYRWWAYRQRRRFRKSVLPLLDQGDAVLEDLGYRRSDILWALHLPLKIDALHALEKRRALRKTSDTTLI